MAHDSSDGSNHQTQCEWKRIWSLLSHFNIWCIGTAYYPQKNNEIQCKWDQLKHFESCDPIYDINQLFNDVKSNI